MHVTLVLGVYKFRREASAADRLSVLQFTHMAWRTLEDTPVFLLRPCECVSERQIQRKREKVREQDRDIQMERQSKRDYACSDEICDAEAALCPKSKSCIYSTMHANITMFTVP